MSGGLYTSLEVQGNFVKVAEGHGRVVMDKMDDPVFINENGIIKS